MKVRHDGKGSIQAVAVDSQNLGDKNVISVEDNQDLLMNPAKYAVVDGSVALRPSLTLTASAASAKADGTTEITVSIQAKKADGTNDATATYAVALMSTPRSTQRPRPEVQGAQGPAPVVTLSAQTVTLVGGIGSLTVKSATPVKAHVLGRADGVVSGAPVAVEFTA